MSYGFEIVGPNGEMAVNDTHRGCVVVDYLTVQNTQTHVVAGETFANVFFQLHAPLKYHYVFDPNSLDYSYIVSGRLADSSYWLSNLALSTVDANNGWQANSNGYYHSAYLSVAPIPVDASGFEIIVVETNLTTPTKAGGGTYGIEVYDAAASVLFSSETRHVTILDAISLARLPKPANNNTAPDLNYRVNASYYPIVRPFYACPNIWLDDCHDHVYTPGCNGYTYRVDRYTAAIRETGSGSLEGAWRYYSHDCTNSYSSYAYCIGPFNNGHPGRFFIIDPVYR